MSDKWIGLTERIIDLSDRGLLKWSETPDPQMFQAEVGSVLIDLDRFPEEQKMVVRIRNSQGDIVDAFDDDDLTRLEPSQWYSRLEKLMNTARRQVSGADQIIDDLMQSLNDLDPDILPF